MNLLMDETPVDKAKAEPVLSPDDFRAIGSALRGTHWQSDVAIAIGVSKSQVTRYLNQTRDLNAVTAQHLQYVIVDQIQSLVRLMDLPGMPHADTPALERATSEMLKALGRVPGQTPPERY